MPLFDYKCNPCAKTFETLQLNSSEPVNCPTCGSADTQKQITGSLSFSIKGPGTYAPGFSSSKSNKRRKK